MLSSMTAYARASRPAGWGRATWELRAVNHRYLELSLRIPEELRPLEARMRERIEGRLKRGKLDCALRLECAAKAAPLALNTELIGQLLQACAAVNKLLDEPAPVSAMDLLRWPGVITSSAPDTEALAADVLALLDEALHTLVETRLREGAKLESYIEARCAQIEAKLSQLRAQLPTILDALKARMLARLAELTSAPVDPGRLEQELALLLQRLDVAEELDRLEAHLGEVRRVLREEEVAGRRLDFLMQEMHREANTLGAKSAHLETTGAAIDLKVLIEQMRELVQNVE